MISELWLKPFSPLKLDIEWWGPSHRRTPLSGGGQGAGLPRRAQQGRPFSSLPLDADSCLVLRSVLAGEAVSWKAVHSHVITDFCRLLEALVSFLDFSDKKAISAMELLTDLAVEER